MVNAYSAVLIYVVWMTFLALFYATPRIPKGVLNGMKFDSWERHKQSPDTGILLRAKGAHLNCVENFAVFAAVVVVAGLMGKIEVVNAVAALVLYARIGQGIVHVIGDSSALVFIRASFFLVQIALILYMVYGLLCH